MSYGSNIHTLTETNSEKDSFPIPQINYINLGGGGSGNDPFSSTYNWKDSAYKLGVLGLLLLSIGITLYCGAPKFAATVSSIAQVKAAGVSFISFGSALIGASIFAIYCAYRQFKESSLAEPEQKEVKTSKTKKTTFNSSNKNSSPKVDKQKILDATKKRQLQTNQSSQ